MCLTVITCNTLPDLNAAKAQERLLDALFGVGGGGGFGLMAQRPKAVVEASAFNVKHLHEREKESLSIKVCFKYQKKIGLNENQFG